MRGRDQILGDREFWARLEFAATRWFQRSDDRGLRRFWIDGFLPESSTNTMVGIDVHGVAWIVDGQKQRQHRFVVSLPQKMLHRRTPLFEIGELSLNQEEPVLRVVLTSLGTKIGAPLNGGPISHTDTSGVTGKLTSAG